MNKDLITIVTGEPRSGTSLQMQTLYLLGCPVEGDPDPISRKDMSTDIKDIREEHANKMNPKGFFEVPGIVIKGTRNLDKFGGKVLKIISGGVYPQAKGTSMEFGTPPEIVNKYILCLRNPKHIAVSQTDLSGTTMVGNEDSNNWAPLKSILSPYPFIGRTGGFVKWLSENKEVHHKFLNVLYDDMIENPRETIEKIIKHLELDPSNEQIEAAVSNVSIDLRRSDSMDEWPEDMEVDGVIADAIFDAMVTFDLGKMKMAATMHKEFMNYQQLENVRWVDDEDTWATIAAQLKRDLMSNANNVADKMRALLPGYRSKRLLCHQCKHYSRDEDNTYETKRPIDLGPLIRPMISCARDEKLKTVEECKHCWQRGSIRDGEVLDPQRHRKG